MTDSFPHSPPKSLYRHLLHYIHSAHTPSSPFPQSKPTSQWSRFYTPTKTPIFHEDFTVSRKYLLRKSIKKSGKEEKKEEFGMKIERIGRIQRRKSENFEAGRKKQVQLRLPSPFFLPLSGKHSVFNR